MNRRLFWQLNLSLLLVALVMFSGVHYVSSQLTNLLTTIESQHSAQIRALAKEAQTLYQQNDTDGIIQLTQNIAEEFGVWSAVILPDNSIISHDAAPADVNLGFQRKLHWPVHYFMKHVVVGVLFDESTTSFVIELPESMYPHVNITLLHYALTIFLPSIMLIIFCWLFYRYIMRPIEALNKAAEQLAEGDLDARALPLISQHRKDELAQVAVSFDSMASRMQQLFDSQRQLLGALSHELRTPLTRIGLAIESFKSDDQKHDILVPRLEREVSHMHQLVEDALTLAWLDGEPQLEREANFNLATLLDLICEDAEFEYQGRAIIRHYPSCMMVEHSSQKLLSQCVENVLRNALKYSKAPSPVRVECRVDMSTYHLTISDQGRGVPPDCLEKIFDPFYRQDAHRSEKEGGFGLGLAICKRQINLLGGKIWADLNDQGGLDMHFVLPRQ